MQNSTTRRIWTILTPSWLSGLVAATATVVVVIGTIIISNYNGSSLQQDLFEANSGSSSTASVLGLQTVTDNLSHNKIVDNLPLFLFWAALGVIVYFFATSIWGALGHAEALREEMHYVNAPKQKLVHRAAMHAIVRLVILGLWLAYLQLFLKVLLPYALAAAHLATNGWSLSNVAYAVLAGIVMFVAVQIHAIFLRLVFLRLRMFSATPL